MSFLFTPNLVFAPKVCYVLDKSGAPQIWAKNWVLLFGGTLFRMVSRATNRTTPIFEGLPIYIYTHIKLNLDILVFAVGQEILQQGTRGEPEGERESAPACASAPFVFCERARAGREARIALSRKRSRGIPSSGWFPKGLLNGDFSGPNQVAITQRFKTPRLELVDFEVSTKTGRPFLQSSNTVSAPCSLCFQ